MRRRRLNIRFLAMLGLLAITRAELIAGARDGLANEKTGVNARDTSQRHERDLPYLEKPIVEEHIAQT